MSDVPPPSIADFFALSEDQHGVRIIKCEGPSEDYPSGSHTLVGDILTNAEPRDVDLNLYRQHRYTSTSATTTAKTYNGRNTSSCIANVDEQNLDVTDGETICLELSDVIVTQMRLDTLPSNDIMTWETDIQGPCTEVYPPVEEHVSQELEVGNKNSEPLAEKRNMLMAQEDRKQMERLLADHGPVTNAEEFQGAVSKSKPPSKRASISWKAGNKGQARDKANGQMRPTSYWKKHGRSSSERLKVIMGGARQNSNEERRPASFWKKQARCALKGIKAVMGHATPTSKEKMALHAVWKKHAKSSSEKLKTALNHNKNYDSGIDTSCFVSMSEVEDTKRQ